MSGCLAVAVIGLYVRTTSSRALRISQSRDSCPAPEVRIGRSHALRASRPQRWGEIPGVQADEPKGPVGL